MNCLKNTAIELATIGTTSVITGMLCQPLNHTFSQGVCFSLASYGYGKSLSLMPFFSSIHTEGLARIVYTCLRTTGGGVLAYGSFALASTVIKLPKELELNDASMAMNVVANGSLAFVVVSIKYLVNSFFQAPPPAVGPAAPAILLPLVPGNQEILGESRVEMEIPVDSTDDVNEIEDSLKSVVDGSDNTVNPELDAIS